MESLSHESLTFYQRSIEFVVWGSRLCQTNEQVTGEVLSQFKRAVISIPLNIAEGSGRQTGKSFLIEIVAMLTALAKSVAGNRIKEDSEPYDSTQTPSL